MLTDREHSRYAFYFAVVFAVVLFSFPDFGLSYFLPHGRRVNALSLFFSLFSNSWQMSRYTGSSLTGDLLFALIHGGFSPGAQRGALPRFSKRSVIVFRFGATPPCTKAQPGSFFSLWNADSKTLPQESAKTFSLIRPDIHLFSAKFPILLTMSVWGTTKTTSHFVFVSSPLFVDFFRYLFS